MKDFYWGLLYQTQKLEIEASDPQKNLALSTNEQGTDLGTLVVPLDQTYHPLHLFISPYLD